jgi:hypothetical protein
MKRNRSDPLMKSMDELAGFPIMLVSLLRK